MTANLAQTLLTKIAEDKHHSSAKVTVVGTGQVGMAAAFAMMTQVHLSFYCSELLRTGDIHVTFITSKYCCMNAFGDLLVSFAGFPAVGAVCSSARNVSEAKALGVIYHITQLTGVRPVQYLIAGRKMSLMPQS